ncbi:MAG: energy transducer TonB [Desulfuromonadales bacterium]|nr:energy transducer TonB [Desulfuromonadales bacterium]
MSWLLDRSSTSLLWEASLLISFLVHALLGLVLLMCWPEAELLSKNIISVELVTLPETAGTEPQFVNDTPAQRAPEPVRQDKPVPRPVTDTPVQRAPEPVRRDRPGAQPTMVSPAPAQQPMPKSTLQNTVTEQATSNTTQDKLIPDNDIFKPAPVEPAETQPIAPATGRHINNAAADRSASGPSSSAADLESVKAAYLQSIATLIDRQKNYPLMARKGRQQGVVHVVFTLDQDGLLDNCHVKESSGFRPLDQAALKAVRQVRRYPDPPPALGEKPSFQIAISFRLED